MLVADRHLGHREDADVAGRLADTEPARVVLSDVERRRSRVRTETEGGREVGIVVGRELRDGDVLEAGDGSLVVVELATVDALAVDLAGADLDPTAALELGHAVGNRHWDLAVRDGEALFPVPDTRERMAAAVEDLLPGGVTYRFEAVPPTTFDGDAPAHDHAHGDAPAHDHAHGDGHAHGPGHSHDAIPGVRDPGAIAGGDRPDGDRASDDPADGGDPA